MALRNFEDRHLLFADIPENLQLPPYTHHLTNFPMLAQEQSNWCWAAIGSMITLYNNNHYGQCQQANLVFGTFFACAWPEDYNNLLSADQITNHWEGDLSYIGNATNGPIDWLRLKSSIYAEFPVEVGLVPIGAGVGHVIVVVGYCEGMQLLVSVVDPAQGQAVMTYDNLLNGTGGYGLGRWVYTWHDIHPR